MAEVRLVPPFRPVRFKVLNDHLILVEHDGPRCKDGGCCLTQSTVRFRYEQHENEWDGEYLKARYQFECPGRWWPYQTPEQYDPPVLCVVEFTVTSRGLIHTINFAELANDLPKTPYWVRADQQGAHNIQFEASSDQKAREIADRYLWMAEAPLEWLVNAIPGTPPRLVDGNRWHRACAAIQAERAE